MADPEFVLAPILLELADIKALQNTQMAMLRVVLNANGVPLDEIERQISKWFAEYRELARADAFKSLGDAIKQLEDKKE